MKDFTYAASTERKVAWTRQPQCLAPSSSKSDLSAGSNLRGWGDNAKIEFPFKSQTLKKFWPDYNGSQANQEVKCGDSSCLGKISSDGDRGEIYCNDYYGTKTSSHNAIWCATWNPYPFAVRGICFNMLPKQAGVGWGFGNMWLLYRDAAGNHTFEEITPNWATINHEDYKSTDPYGDRWSFHKNQTSDYKHFNSTVKDVNNSGTWANFQGGVSGFDKYENLYCIGWAGFLTIQNDAQFAKDHGFVFEDLILLPEKTTPRTVGAGFGNYWVGGKCDQISNIQSRGKRILLQDA